jgi:hypothetical protein
MDPSIERNVPMSRVQLALNVDNLDEAITFYSKLFNMRPRPATPSRPINCRRGQQTFVASSIPGSSTSKGLRTAGSGADAARVGSHAS